MIARTAISKPSTAPGERKPGRAVTGRASAESVPRRASMAVGSASRSRRRQIFEHTSSKSRESLRLTRPITASAVAVTLISAGPEGVATARVYVSSSTASIEGTRRSRRYASVSLKSIGAWNGSRTVIS